MGFSVKVNNTTEKEKKKERRGFRTGQNLKKIKDAAKKETEKRNEMRKKEKNEEKRLRKVSQSFKKEGYRRRKWK